MGVWHMFGVLRLLWRSGLTSSLFHKFHGWGHRCNSGACSGKPMIAHQDSGVRRSSQNSKTIENTLSQVSCMIYDCFVWRSSDDRWRWHKKTAYVLLDHVLGFVLHRVKTKMLSC